ncbi:MAG: glycoside hydrolase family 2 TIM barrel-domain containing protein, partial [Planctomycetota bacterium]
GPGWYRTFLSNSDLSLPDLSPADSQQSGSQQSNPGQSAPKNRGRLLLHFEGAGQKSEVYVYTTKVGEHVGGYDEWSVDITDQVAQFLQSEDAKRFDGRVPIAVRCDNSRDLEMIPSDLSDFNVYGGLYRYVNLMKVPGVSLTRADLNASVDSSGIQGRIGLRVFLQGDIGKNDPASLDVAVVGPDGNLVAQSSFSASKSGEPLDLGGLLVEQPELWSPDSPSLYRCEIKTKHGDDVHHWSHVVGFRHLQWIEKGPFKINGQRLLLRGTHRHEDHAGLGAAMPESLLRKELSMMKDMGVNFIRLGHYQQSRIVLELCDQLGILVWEEIPWCRGGLGGEAYRQQARDMLTNMIAQHRNHPSVFIWGLGNENDWPNDFARFDEEEIRSFMTELHELSHQLDPSRKTAIRRCDFCKDVVDIYSPSIWAGWYRGKFTDYRTVSEKEMNGVNHFLHVEWGASNHARRHSEDPDRGIENVVGGQGADERDGDASMYGGSARVSKDGDWTETYACNLIDWHLKEQEKMPWLTGTAYWPFKDFSTPVRPENPVPYVNQKGVVERDFEKKEGFYVFQSYWTQKPMARIYGHTWPVRWGKANEPRMVKVYSNCGQAELFLNGVSQGTKQRDSQNFPAAGLRWNVNFREGENTLKVIATDGDTQVVDQISLRYQTQPWESPVRLKLQVVGENDRFVELEATAHDEQGVLCLDAKAPVRFSLAGDGKLLDNLGTSRGSRVVQLYNGRARIRVQQGRKSVVSVSSTDLESGFVTLQ